MLSFKDYFQLQIYKLNVKNIKFFLSLLKLTENIIKGARAKTFYTIYFFILSLTLESILVLYKTKMRY